MGAIHLTRPFLLNSRLRVKQTKSDLSLQSGMGNSLMPAIRVPATIYTKVIPVIYTQDTDFTTLNCSSLHLLFGER